MSTYKIEILKDKVQLARRTTEVLREQILLTLSHQEGCFVALSGGSTPSLAYSFLGEELLPWNRVNVFLGDERWVAHDDESSNARMLRNTLLSAPPGSDACFYPIPTTDCQTPEESSLAFSRLLGSVFSTPQPIFDLILLGLGADGHTASLFPGSQSLNVKDSFTTVGRGNNQERITLTASTISLAKKIVFLVSGTSKQIALKRLLDQTESYERTPAKLVQPGSEVLVLADVDAAMMI